MGWSPDQATTYLQLIGILLGQLFFGFLGDAIGRKRAMLLDMAVILAGVILLPCAAGPTPEARRCWPLACMRNFSVWLCVSDAVTERGTSLLSSCWSSPCPVHAVAQSFVGSCFAHSVLRRMRHLIAGLWLPMLTKYLNNNPLAAAQGWVIMYAWSQFIFGFGIGGAAAPACALHAPTCMLMQMHA